MKNNKKGFTLIELLAIIVILAIIAVITVPIILNIIDNARKGAARNSVIGYGKSVELAYTQYQYDSSLGTAPTATGSVDDGSLIYVTIDATTGTNTTPLHVDFDGDKVVCTGAQKSIVNGKVKLTGCKVGTRSETYSYEEGKATEDQQ